jgi:hypothetical protein
VHASFEFEHTAVVDIPELDMFEQFITLSVEIDEILENHHIDAVYLNEIDEEVTNIAIREEIIKRFEADNGLVDAMYDAAYDWLGNSMW